MHAGIYMYYLMHNDLFTIPRQDQNLSSTLIHKVVKLHIGLQNIKSQSSPTKLKIIQFLL